MPERDKNPNQKDGDSAIPDWKQELIKKSVEEFLRHNPSGRAIPMPTN